MKENTRKIVSAICVVLIAYFLLGLVGVLPQNYDVVRRTVPTAQETPIEYKDQIYFADVEGIKPLDVEIDHVNGKIWVMGNQANQINIYNLDMTIDDTIYVLQGSYCRCMVVDESEGLAFVFSTDNNVNFIVSKIDLDTHQIIDTFNIYDEEVYGDWIDIDYGHFTTDNFIVLSGWNYTNDRDSVLSLSYDFSKFYSYTTGYNGVCRGIVMKDRDVQSSTVRDFYITDANDMGWWGAIFHLKIGLNGIIVYGNERYDWEMEDPQEPQTFMPCDIKIKYDNEKIIVSGYWKYGQENTGRIMELPMDLSNYNILYVGNWGNIPFIECGKSESTAEYYYFSDTNETDMCIYYYDGEELHQFIVGFKEYYNVYDLYCDDENQTVYYPIQYWGEFSKGNTVLDIESFDGLGILYPIEQPPITPPTPTEMENITITVTQAGDNGKATVDTVIPIEAQVECNDTIESVRVIYQGVDSDQYKTVDLELTSGDENLGLWSGNIPAQDDVGTVTCQVYAKSSTGNEAITSFFDIYIEELQPAPTPAPAITIDPTLFYGSFLILFTAVGVVVNYKP